MKKGWILPVFLLILLVAVGAFIYTKYSKKPNENTINEAGRIGKYPYAKSWEMKEAKNLCFLATDECNQPVTITFESQNEWSRIYGHYMDSMPPLGWSTKSRVVTSIPTDVVFTKDTCIATLKPREGNFLEEAENTQNLENYIYQMVVTCKPS